METTNRQYKSSVFTTLFAEEEKLLELYSALSRHTYGKDAKIEINTLINVLYNGLQNDISFTIGDRLVVLIGHQSTVNNNLPLRALMYIARVYEKIIDKKSVYRQKLMMIPTPEFIVLYNGVSDFPEEKEMRLTDAFRERPAHPEKYGSLELVVRVLNINPGYNIEIVSRSPTLSGYVTFTGKVREGLKKGLAPNTAITEAVQYCTTQGILQPFLSNHASEVENMLTTEFNMEDAREVWEEEAREEGLEKGLEKGLKQGLKQGLKKGREKGLKQGLKKGRETIAIEMKNEGFSDDMIAKITKLPINKVRNMSL